MRARIINLYRHYVRHPAATALRERRRVAVEARKVRDDEDRRRALAKAQQIKAELQGRTQ
ncbi:hypothetical protein [Sphingobium sp. CECT 9361]|jgi:hypothetical protein|uniref:hypothetical protein n=1 Tax=Sphingobium sp. CECT 9361 TaxID=2845384 RepID=UPI001E31B26D|nr:hypothetical protein [Sphingobium sp. CECT 9361]CAH0355332.1 hypothetical protein SPH9361_03409 [Sphingobium sp. CECT 9361]